jgi:glutamate formiminotransferase
VNLATDDLEVARAVARRLRERDGGLPGVRALGMRMAQRGCTQVSVNITRPDLVPLHRVLELAREEAARRGAVVAGTELIGTCRFDDLLAAAQSYLALEHLTARQVVDVAAGVVDLPELPPLG